MDALRQHVASGKRVCASTLHALATTRRAIGGAVNSVIVVDDFEGVSLGRSGSKGEDEVGGAGRLGSGELLNNTTESTSQVLIPEYPNNCFAGSESTPGIVKREDIARTIIHVKCSEAERTPNSSEPIKHFGRFREVLLSEDENRRRGPLLTDALPRSTGTATQALCE
ncbi:uncharacterized protein FOMMEDRAFT_159142 [Fomitiporia mediterranea MF3/22]|uniref:uncharacterized protein n=1 Tax=Fomitiporia mediterranea (strain MF3/22) TaxID=694068 RepID=UPI0004408743|nr:uncharacterized protein FOMMEDRAFT_159142 [Fomitiporia mediterranea MF3/22]EJD00452.1 hypothetical protein FOMMEDRAFT_159142 [Fomitiporia mediterranea MF3/22]